MAIFTVKELNEKVKPLLVDDYLLLGKEAKNELKNFREKVDNFNKNHLTIKLFCDCDELTKINSRNKNFTERMKLLKTYMPRDNARVMSAIESIEKFQKKESQICQNRKYFGALKPFCSIQNNDLKKLSNTNAYKTAIKNISNALIKSLELKNEDKTNKQWLEDTIGNCNGLLDNDVLTNIIGNNNKKLIEQARSRLLLEQNKRKHRTI